MDLKAIAAERLKLGASSTENRKQLIAGSAAVAALLVLVVAALVGAGSGGTGGQQAAAVRQPLARVDVAPEDGAGNVEPDRALKVAAVHGRLAKVQVKDAKGAVVPGRTTASGWRPDAGHLADGTKYTVAATAVGAGGRHTVKHSSFTTLRPKHTFVGIYTPDDRAVVGVGMPVSINFTHAIAPGDRAAVEKAIKVTADPGVDIEGHWFGTSRLDFRPEHYWKPGTRVTVALHLNGVRGADGVWGTQQRTARFTVDRSQVSYVDAKKKTMVVKRNGKKIKTFDITSGSDQHPTWNGRMVISERHRTIRMDGDTVGFGRDEKAGGYDIKDVPHAMRLTTSGTFVHGNYWLPESSFGRTNASHGCVGLFDTKGGGSSTPAAWFFDHSIVGDVVQIKNSHDKTVPPDNGLNGWNMSWAAWKAPQ